MPRRQGLRVVASGPELSAPDEPPVDVTALLRADIAKRDWTGVHVTADRRPFIAWPDTPKRIWRA